MALTPLFGVTPLGSTLRREVGTFSMGRYSHLGQDFCLHSITILEFREYHAFWDVIYAGRNFHGWAASTKWEMDSNAQLR